MTQHYLHLYCDSVFLISIAIKGLLYILTPLSTHIIHSNGSWPKSVVFEPNCDLVESVFGHVCAKTGRKYANTQIQTRSQRHPDAVHFCSKTNMKWKSNKFSICDLHSHSRRDQWKYVVVLIANTPLRRVEFGIWLSNPTEKFEISLGCASWDFNFSVVFEPNSTPQKRVYTWDWDWGGLWLIGA